MMKYLAILSLFLFSITSVNGQSKNAVRVALPEEVIYKIVEGDTLKLQFMYPEGVQNKRKHNTIIFFFGGGWRGGSTTQFEDQAKYFASRGMIAVLADYRVENRHHTTPFDAVEDAKSAIRYLRIHAKILHINENKIVGAGGSAGGHLAAATAILNGLDAANEDISVSSKANVLMLFNPVIDNGEGGYGYERVSDRYLEISPLHNIKKGAPPTIIFQGTEDKHIPVATAEKYKAAMEAVGSRCDLHLYEGQPHGFFNKGKKDSVKYYRETLHEADLFLESLGYLKGEPTI